MKRKSENKNAKKYEIGDWNEKLNINKSLKCFIYTVLSMECGFKNKKEKRF